MKIVAASGVLAELINIGLVVVDVGSPRLLLQAGADALECGAGIDMTTDYDDTGTGVPIMKQCLPHRVLEGGFANHRAPLMQ